METKDFYIPLFISIIGIAYPILLQVIARLDEKYSSDKIVNLFDKEKENTIFRYSLYFTAFFAFIWSLKLQPLPQIKKSYYIIDNSADLLLVASNILLIISFFSLINKVLIYYSPEKLTNYFIDKHKIKKESKYFSALNDILIFLLQTKKRDITYALNEYFYEAFKDIRENQIKKHVEYPIEYYQLVRSIVEEIVLLPEKGNLWIERASAGNIWLLGDNFRNNSMISDNTYAYMWNNFIIITNYKNADLIMNHWQNAHSMFSNYLNEASVEPIMYEKLFDNEYANRSHFIRNQKQKFIEFHYALGGLLLAQSMSDCLSRIFRHTNSDPPRYELLPNSMDEIFNFYMKINDNYSSFHYIISSNYPFPNGSGINADEVSRKWINKYMAVLFLRQYKIWPYLITMKPLDYPTIPDSQSEIRTWIFQIDNFKATVESLLNEVTLLNDVDLSFLTKEWCITNNKEYPLDFISNLTVILNDKYEINARTLPLSTEKIKLFKNQVYLIENTINMIKLDNIGHTPNQDYKRGFIRGSNSTFTRDFFVENPENSYDENYVYLAFQLTDNIKCQFQVILFQNTRTTYRILKNDFFNALDKLKINNDHIFILFNVDINYYINDLKVPQLKEDNYKGINIISISNKSNFEPTIFVLKKQDYPYIIDRPATEEEIENYQLKKSSETLNIFTSIIDLNTSSAEFRSELKSDKSDDELQKSLLLTIGFELEILIKSNIEIVKIEEFIEDYSYGLPDSLEVIIPLQR